MFQLQTCDDYVHTTKVVTLKQLLSDQKQVDPTVKVAYHTTFDIAGVDKLAFGIKTDHEIYFVSSLTDSNAADKDAVTQTTIGAMIPPEGWLSMAHCKLIWAVKWGTLGLTPIRPLVIFAQSCELQGGKAFKL